MTTLYVKAPLRQTANDIIRNDEERKFLLAKLRDPEYYVKNVRWFDSTRQQLLSAENIDGFLYEWEQKAKSITTKHGNVKVVSQMYRKCKAEPVGSDGTKFSVKFPNGDTKTVSIRETSPYDPSHDTREDDAFGTYTYGTPDDVVNINGFGDAALLRTLKRRMIDELKIYTYVGDIIIALNPYMWIPHVVDVIHTDRPINYQLGENPHVFAAAHFAYWGLLDPSRYGKNKPGLKNQSCIVSGESGAGKTVSCTDITKYLVKLSQWRVEELGGPPVPDHHDDNSSSSSSSSGGGKQTIAELVAGVSPFFEAFGNAKTNQNDNSSRFGKFTRIFFGNGVILGADIDHYLLEKGRTVSQGHGERNYHIFYFMCKGLSPSEKQELGLKNPEDYTILKGCTTVPKMNDQKEMVEVRSSLAAVAKIEAAEQAVLWSILTGLLKLGNVTFAAKEYVTKAGSKQTGSWPKDMALIAEVAKHLGMEPAELATGLTTVEIQPDKRKPAITSYKPVKTAEQFVGALIRDIYNKIFDYIVQTTSAILSGGAGKDLAKTSEGYVALLDIFGFEVFAVNSFEQLCINFANEKLQWLFNEHVFSEEESFYKSQGLNQSMPKWRKNTPCCELVEYRDNKHFIGVMHLLDDVSRGNPNNTDAKLFNVLKKAWGADQKPPAAPIGKTQRMRNASEFFYVTRDKPDKKTRAVLAESSMPKALRDYHFCIKHFAKDVKYYVHGFLEKNRDDLPSQLRKLVEGSNVPFLNSLFPPLKASKSGKGGKTIAKTFLSDLKRLKDHLWSTNPHYVRCIKPNDFKARPIDGSICFDAGKTHKQLLYAGVKKICDIRKQGFPFREPFKLFWARCLKNEYHLWTKPPIDSAIDPMEGCRLLCEQALPEFDANADPRAENASGGGKPPFWVMGSTMVLGKDRTLSELAKWHNNLIMPMINRWARVSLIRNGVTLFVDACRALGDAWRVKYFKIKYEAMAKQLIVAQAMTRSIMAAARFQHLQRSLKAAVAVQTSWRVRDLSRKWMAIAQQTIRHRATESLQAFSQHMTRSAAQKMAVTTLGRQLVAKLHSLRKRIRIQRHFKGFLARRHFQRTQHSLRNTALAVSKVANFYAMQDARATFCFRLQLIPRVQAVVRGLVYRVWYWRVQEAVLVLQAFARMATLKRKYRRRLAAIRDAQKFLRFSALRTWFRKKAAAVAKIREIVTCYLRARLVNAWFAQMDRACRLGDVEACRELMKREGVFENLRRIPGPFLVNMRDQVYFTSLVHMACRSGSLETVKYLVSQGAMLTHVDLVGDTALHHAVQAGDKSLDVVQYLLEEHQKTVRAAANASGTATGGDNDVDSDDDDDLDNSRGSKGSGGDNTMMLANNISAQLFSILRRRNAAGQCALDVAIDVRLDDGESKTKLIAWLVDHQADVTSEALDMIDEEIDEAERNIADRRQLAERCSKAEEMEITNDAFYQLMSIGPDAEDRAVIQRARRREREAAVRLQKWVRRRNCTVTDERFKRSRSLVYWREAMAENGSVFYYHISDNRAQWEAPAKYMTLEEQAQQNIGGLDAATNRKLLMDVSPVHQQIRAITRAIHAEVTATKAVHENTTQYMKQLENQLEDLESKAAQDEAAIRAEETKAERERVRKLQESVVPSPDVKRALMPGAPPLSLPLRLQMASRIFQGFASNSQEGKRDLGDSSSDKMLYHRPGEAPPDPLAFDNVGWYYKDMAGVNFGPFRSKQMRGWLTQGYFELTLPVRLGTRGDFLPLRKWFPVIKDAFPDSAREILEPLRSVLVQRAVAMGEAPESDLLRLTQSERKSDGREEKTGNGHLVLGGTVY